MEWEIIYYSKVLQEEILKLKTTISQMKEVKANADTWRTQKENVE